jgi:hypothetical protein
LLRCTFTEGFGRKKTGKTIRPPVIIRAWRSRTRLHEPFKAAANKRDGAMKDTMSRDSMKNEGMKDGATKKN